MGTPIRERIAVTHPDLLLPFGVDNLANSQTDTALAAILTSTKWSLPFGGWVVGLGIALSASFVSGVLSWDIVINGVQKSIDTVTTPGALFHNIIYPSGLYRFEAGQKLGVSYTSGTLGAATVDAAVMMMVVLDGVQN